MFCLLSASTMSSCLASLVLHSWCTVSTSSWCFDIWQLRRPLEVLWAYSAPDAWEELQYCREVSNWPAVQKYYIFASFMTTFVLTCVIQSWWVPAVTCNHLFVVPGIHEVISVFFQEVPIVLLFLPETCCWMSALWCWLVLGHCFGLLSGPTQLNSGWVCTSFLFFLFFKFTLTNINITWYISYSCNIYQVAFNFILVKIQNKKWKNLHLHHTITLNLVKAILLSIPDYFIWSHLTV